MEEMHKIYFHVIVELLYMSTSAQNWKQKNWFRMKLDPL